MVDQAEARMDCAARLQAETFLGLSLALASRSLLAFSDLVLRASVFGAFLAVMPGWSLAMGDLSPESAPFFSGGPVPPDTSLLGAYFQLVRLVPAALPIFFPMKSGSAWLDVSFCGFCRLVVVAASCRIPHAKERAVLPCLSPVAISCSVPPEPVSHICLRFFPFFFPSLPFLTLSLLQ